MNELKRKTLIESGATVVCPGPGASATISGPVADPPLRSAAHDWASANLEARPIQRNANKNLAVQKINAEEIIELYKKNVWRKTPGVTLDNYETLRKLVNEIENKNTRQCRTLGVFENNELCAGGIFLISDKKIIFLFGAANRTGRKNAAMRFLFDRMIKQYCRKNYVLDFEGSCINTVEYFYKGFGPYKVTFLNVHFSRFRVLDYSISIKQKLSKMVLKMFL